MEEERSQPLKSVHLTAVDGSDGLRCTYFPQDAKHLDPLGALLEEVHLQGAVSKVPELVVVVI